MSDPKRRRSTSTSKHRELWPRPVHFIFILEAGRWEVSHRGRSSRWGSKGVVEGIWPCRIRLVRQTRFGWVHSGPGAAVRGVGILTSCCVVGVVFSVAFLVEAGNEALDDLCLEEIGQVGDALGGEEDPLELIGQSGPVFFFFLLSPLLSIRSLLRYHRDAKRQGGGRDILPGGELETVDTLVADSQAADVGLGAEAIDADDVAHGGLRVGVDEGV